MGETRENKTSQNFLCKCDFVQKNFMDLFVKPRELFPLVNEEAYKVCLI